MATFQKAVKTDSKLRLALCGPAGSGKTFSLLAIATELGGPIAFVDTEHGSASKYADLFAFDVIEPDVFDPRDLITLIKDAIAGGYRVICIDSLSHYWMGKGGELEMVDSAAKRTQGNSFAAWKHVTPVHNELVDTIISAQIHVLVSMRTKTEWVIEKDDRGKSVPRKIGLAPVMRDGIEFEFDVCGDMDQENTLTITKSRCPDLTGKAINRPGKDVAQTLKKWLSGAPATPRPTPQPQPTQQSVAQQKIADMQAGKPYAETAQPDPRSQNTQINGVALADILASMKDFKSCLSAFAAMKKLMAERGLPETEYYRVLDGHGAKHANDFKTAAQCKRAVSSLWEVYAAAPAPPITPEVVA